MYFEAYWLPQWSEQTFGNSISCVPSPNQTVHRELSLRMARKFLMRSEPPRTSTRSCACTLTTMRAQVGYRWSSLIVSL